MSEDKHPEHVRRAAKECGLDPDEFVHVGQIPCPEHIGRKGRYVKKDGTETNLRFDGQTENAHEHGEHTVCAEPADVWDRTPVASGSHFYHSTCTKDPGHVHEFDADTFASFSLILRRAT